MTLIRPLTDRARLDLPGAVLALDLGTHCGCAIRHVDGRIAYNTLHFEERPGEGRGGRFLRFRYWLTETKNTAGGFAGVFYEEVRFGKFVGATQVWAGLEAILTAWAHHHQIPYEGFPVQTIKKFATGTGAAKKSQMMAAVREWGFSPQDDNQADALAILHMGLERHSKEMAA